MTSLRTLSLNDGSQLPGIGFGTYPLKGQEATDAVTSALDIGYRLIDTAVNYGNEDAVGRAIAESPVPRSEITLTTKLPGRDHGYDETLRSFDASAAALGVDAIDLYLIHWPNPSVGKFTESWKAMVQLQRDHRVRSIGVSNFTREFLERLGKRLAEKGMSIELTPAAKVLLATRGYDPAMGARPLRRTMQREIEDQLSEKILFGDLKPGELVSVDVEGEGDEAKFTFTGHGAPRAIEEAPSAIEAGVGDGQ